MGKKEKKAKKECDYFEMMVRGVKFSCKAAELLKTNLENFDPNTLQARMEEMHVIEHNADISKHDTMSELMRAFITPIEREDIILLIQEIDDVTDAIEDVLIRTYMFNVAAIREEALEFADVIVRCCEVLKDTLKEFRHFRKSIPFTKTSWKSTGLRRKATHCIPARCASCICPRPIPSS